MKWEIKEIATRLCAHGAVLATTPVKADPKALLDVLRKPRLPLVYLLLEKNNPESFEIKGRILRTVSVLLRLVL